MENANSILLNRFFTRNTFKQLIDEGHSPTYSAAIRRYVSKKGTANRECISEIYQYLKSNYQNEYYYKNTLLNKLLLGVHSPRTTTALTELPIGDSKADFILINGKAIVYEIKTLLDNFDRLDGQLSDYFKAFTRVTVVTDENNFLDLQSKLVDTPVGICILTSRGTLSMRKQPIEYTGALSKTIMFRILRKAEQEEILRQQFRVLPNTSQFEYYRACQDLFETIPTETAYQSFIQALKSRVRIRTDLYAKIPYELKFLAYFSNYNEYHYSELLNFLET